jgi:3-hydroxyisobutyrate dehydrogenase
MASRRNVAERSSAPSCGGEGLGLVWAKTNIRLRTKVGSVSCQFIYDVRTAKLRESKRSIFMNVLGFIGLGIMGESMCENIIRKSGKPVYVYDIDASKIAKLAACGGKAAASIQEVAEKADVIFSMVPNNEHIKAVIAEILKAMRPGTILVDMSTVSPKISAALAEQVKQKGGIMLDCPVVKSKPAAIKGELGIYAGGDKAAYEKVRPLLGYMGANVIYMGKNGQALVMKLVHNLMVGGIQSGVNEALLVAEKAGLNFDDVVKAISYGGAQCFYLDAKHKSLKEGNFAPAFSFGNMHKDMRLTKDLIADFKLSLEGFRHILEIYEKGMAQGLGGEDFSATYKVVKENSGK